MLRLALWTGWAGLGLALLQSLRVPLYRPPARRVTLGRPEDFALGLTPLPLYQAWLIRTPEGFYALRSVCTHLGCPPQWQPQSRQFLCPCHGSRFADDGSLKQGPALRALERYELSTGRDGRLMLNLDRTYRREDGGWNLPGAFVSWRG